MRHLQIIGDGHAGWNPDRQTNAVQVDLLSVPNSVPTAPDARPHGTSAALGTVQAGLLVPAPASLPTADLYVNSTSALASRIFSHALHLVGASLLLAPATAQIPSGTPSPLDTNGEGGVVAGSYLVQFDHRIDRSPLRAAHRSGNTLAVDRAIQRPRASGRTTPRRVRAPRTCTRRPGRTAVVDHRRPAHVDGLDPIVLATLPGIIAVTPNPRAATARRTGTTQRVHQRATPQHRRGQPAAGCLQQARPRHRHRHRDPRHRHHGRAPAATSRVATPTIARAPASMAARCSRSMVRVDSGPRTANAHGTHVAGDACANRAPDDGPAPAAGVVGIKVDDNTGSATDSWLITAWQLVAQHKTRHGIQVANNSYTGSPTGHRPSPASTRRNRLGRRHRDHVLGR